MSLDIEVRAADGSPAGTLTLDADHFGIEPHVSVLHQVVTAQLAAARAGTQSTKTRAEVSGGGKKPFKQKGTGRARQGSERAPHFSGGGVALGPKPRSYKQRTPRKMINLALRSALSDRQSQGRIAVVTGWGLTAPSTKAARAALTALEVTGKILVVLSRDDAEAYKSFRNLPEVQVILRGELNAYDILCNDWIVFTPATLPGYEGETLLTLGPTRTTPSEESVVEELAEQAVAELVAEATLDEAVTQAAVEDAVGELVDEALAGADATPQAQEDGAAAGTTDDAVALSPEPVPDDAEEAQ